MFCFMGFTVEEDHIFGSFRGIAEAVSEVEAEGGAVFIAGGKACPIPCIVVCPDSSSPIEEPHRGSGVEGSFIVSTTEFSLCRHAVYFYVIIKCLCIFMERYYYCHKVFGRRTECDIAFEIFVFIEVFHHADKSSRIFVRMPEGDITVFFSHVTSPVRGEDGIFVLPMVKRFILETVLYFFFLKSRKLTEIIPI